MTMKKYLLMVKDIALFLSTDIIPNKPKYQQSQNRHHPIDDQTIDLNEEPLPRPPKESFLEKKNQSSTSKYGDELGKETLARGQRVDSLKIVAG